MSSNTTPADTERSDAGTIEVLDPTYEESSTSLAPARRLDSLADRTVGVVSNGKHGTVSFFDALERELRELGVGEVVRVTKPNYSAPAGDEILDRTTEWNALISGIGD